MSMSPEDSSKQRPHNLKDLTQGRDEVFLQPVTAGIVRAVLLSSLGADYPVDQESCRKTARHTVLKVLGMPGFLRLPMIILTVVFDVCGLFFGGKLFRHLSQENQHRQFTAWQESLVGPCRDLTMFYQKMSIFIYFSVAESQKEYA